ncbi:MAG: putative TauD/TfdA family dioxygenase [Betaproteobacteria bacterium]|nr:putative TauD/TfdA family dioxygenase [Betaproteobacteria bacterium]
MATAIHSSNMRGVTVEPMRAALGAEVDCGDVKSLDETSFALVKRAFLDNLVLLIRGQTLADADLLAFGRRFGELSAAAPVHIGQKPRALPELAVISNVLENGVAIGGLGDGEAVWHSDSCFNQIPPSASILHSLEIPPAGGDTGFTNMYMALDTLPQALRAAIKGKTIKHDMRYTSGGQLRPGYTGEEDIRSTPGPSHALVRRHPETGCNALYLGRRPHAYINDLPLDESEALLEALWEHAARPEASWHHQWRVGDILIWDNRCAMHRRDAFDPDSRRVMHRTQCKGTPVIEGADSAPRHSRAQPAR